ncbi:MAG: hypothetical protein PVF22_04850 [Candidatus Aminicenantes bacterium]|jgi:hypothetical protein
MFEFITKIKITWGGLFIFLFLGSVQIYGQTDVAYLVVTDDTQSSLVGANNLLSLHRWIYGIENRYLKPSWTEEKTFIKKTLGIVYRLSRTVFLDNVVDHMAFLFQHEVFGHGARYREFGYTDNTYSLHPVYPYGDAKGWARRGRMEPGRKVTIHERLAMVSGGSEANTLFSSLLRRNWLIRGHIHHRESILYLLTGNDLAAYILRTKHGLRKSGLNDVLNYLSLLNAQHGYVQEEDYRISLDDLAQHAWLNLLNPFLYFSLYNYFVSYLWAGQEESSLPMIRLGNVKYLPAFRIGLAPFGPEIYFEHFFKTGQRWMSLYFRRGKPTFASFWGAGLSVGNLLRVGHFTLEGRLDVWHQPSLLLGGERVSEGQRGLGGALMATVFYRFSPGQSPLNLIAQLGYKTDGFLAGERLDKGFYARVGISFIER